jgi:hypothetical protein
MKGTRMISGRVWRVMRFGEPKDAIEAVEVSGSVVAARVGSTASSGC